MEDFCTFLKQQRNSKRKGLNRVIISFGYKLIFSDENTIKYISDIGAYENEYFGINIPCPSISQVLKWFRDENIYCLPWFEQGVDMWFYAICKPTYGCEFPEFMSKSDYDTYEQAAIAGIEYVLDNLIQL